MVVGEAPRCSEHEGHIGAKCVTVASWTGTEPEGMGAALNELGGGGGETLAWERMTHMQVSWCRYHSMYFSCCRTFFHHLSHWVI